MRISTKLFNSFMTRLLKRGAEFRSAHQYSAAFTCVQQRRRLGLFIPDGHRWGLPNLRHSLSTWLVNQGKENPKTVQGILGHARIQTTLDLYTDEDLDG